MDSYVYLIILDFLHSVVIAFFLFSLSLFPFSFFYLSICALVFLLTCNLIYFYLILLSAGCLAPPAPMVIPGSQYSNFYLYYFHSCNLFSSKRVSTNKDCCCSPQFTVLSNFQFSTRPPKEKRLHYRLIIQHTDTLPKCGHKALAVRRST